MLRIGLLLSGNGALDGSDPTQVVAWRMVTARAGHVLLCMAPDRDQADVIGLQGRLDEPPRHVLTESARLTAGRIDPVDRVDADLLDVLVVPGGLGTRKNLGNHRDAAESRLARALLDSGAVVVLMDEAVAWFAEVRPADPAAACRLAVGADRDTREIVRAQGHDPVEQIDTWIEDPSGVLSVQLGSDPPPHAVLDACEEGLRRLESRFGSDATGP